MIVSPRLNTQRTVIRLLTPADAEKLLRFRINNKAHLAPWEPSRDESWYTLDACARSIVDGAGAARLDHGYPLVVFNLDETDVLASFTFSNVARGPFQAALLGYGIDAQKQGQGLMHEALHAGLQWAFGELDLHRIMANYLPRNERSARLLERLGFEREGYAKSYLKIAGQWQDHVLTAKVRESS